MPSRVGCYPTPHENPKSYPSEKLMFMRALGVSEVFGVMGAPFPCVCEKLQE